MGKLIVTGPDNEIPSSVKINNLSHVLLNNTDALHSFKTCKLNKTDYFIAISYAIQI
jgi:hypothetical protein